MLKKLSKTQNAQENEKLVQAIKSRLIYLNNETKKMYRNENEKANEINQKLLTLLNNINKDKD